MVKYLKPINNKIEEIKNAPSNGIFLVGEEGSGKTTTLLEYVEQSRRTSNPVIDITPISIYSLEVYVEFAKLYIVCNTLQKMLLYIKDNYLKCYVEHFLFFNTKITNIQDDIITIYIFDKYDIKDTSITKDILKNPEILLDEFLLNAIKYLKYNNLTVVLDNFDIEKPYIRLYQTYLYDTLKKYLRVVATISDPNTINNPQKLNKLAKNNSLIILDYNREIDTVKKILDDSLPIKQNQNVISKRVSFLFSNSVIEQLITKTNGNLFAMILAIRIFFEHINEINPDEYDNALLTIVDENLKFNSLLLDRQKKRKLYLK